MLLLVLSVLFTVALVGLAVVAVVRAHLRRLAADAEERLRPLGPALRHAHATSLGVTSRGAGQVRGTGTLHLGRSHLTFAQWRPAGLLRIPRAGITEVGTTRSHLGKAVGRDLLLVRWADDGVEGSIALVVDDLGGWQRDLG